jgi:hypothetical protein
MRTIAHSLETRLRLPLISQRNVARVRDLAEHVSEEIHVVFLRREITSHLTRMRSMAFAWKYEKRAQVLLQMEGKVLGFAGIAFYFMAYLHRLFGLIAKSTILWNACADNARFLYSKSHADLHIALHMRTFSPQRRDAMHDTNPSSMKYPHSSTAEVDL